MMIYEKSIFITNNNIMDFFYISEIIKDKLYLSGVYPIVTTFDIIRKKNITCIISITEYKTPFYNELSNCTVLHLNVNDNSRENIMKYFTLTNAFIDYYSSKNCKILVHCIAGISRSATIIIAYLLYKLHKKHTLLDIINYVKSRRKIINPNRGFLRQLVEYDNSLRM